MLTDICGFLFAAHCLQGRRGVNISTSVLRQHQTYTAVSVLFQPTDHFSWQFVWGCSQIGCSRVQVSCYVPSNNSGHANHPPDWPGCGSLHCTVPQAETAHWDLVHIDCCCYWNGTANNMQLPLPQLMQVALIFCVL